MFMKVRWASMRALLGAPAFHCPERFLLGSSTPIPRGGDVLIGIPHRFSVPELLFTLRAMGHGDEIALVDGNYPARNTFPGG